MRLRLLDHLVCPLDKAPLELRIWESRRRALSAAEIERAEQFGIDRTKLSEEIDFGILINPRRGVYYPIYEGVPRLLTFPSGVSEQFERRFRERISSEIPSLSLPHENPAPGELDVLRSFSSEWLNYDWDGQTYWNLTPDMWFDCMRFILEVDEHPVAGKLVLEAGMGIGGVADYMARAEGCEMVGLDLGYAVDVCHRHFAGNSFLHIVQASAFAPPFALGTFDFVYSFGVIHHTFSTLTAFKSLAQLPKQGGRLFVWVYSPYDESRTPVRRGLMALERVVRPTVWRMPTRLQSVALAPLIPLYMLHQWRRSVHRGRSEVRYGVREALHAARDRFTPRYIHRHTDVEVCSWFKNAGYEGLTCSSARARPEFVPESFTACTGVSGVRK